MCASVCSCGDSRVSSAIVPQILSSRFFFFFFLLNSVSYCSSNYQGWLASDPQGLLSPALQLWGYKQALLCLGFCMGVLWIKLRSLCSQDKCFTSWAFSLVLAILCKDIPLLFSQRSQVQRNLGLKADLLKVHPFY